LTQDTHDFYQTTLWDYTEAGENERKKGDNAVSLLLKKAGLEWIF